jgi:exodeoxyribonuclease-3
MIRIYSWNVNGIRAVVRKGALQDFMTKHNPDILCLQETKAQKGQTEINFREYEEYWNSAHKAGYSGTAIFTKIKPRNVINDFPASYLKRFNLTDDKGRNSAAEGRIIAAEFEKFWLVNVYAINAKDDLSRLDLKYKHWDPAFLAYIKELEEKKPVIICGDLNVAHTEDDLARPKENEGKKGFTKEEREGFQKYIDAGFVDAFRMFKKGNGYYTWWTHWANARARNIGWRIDYFLVSKKLKSKIKNADIHAEVTGSDHAPISLTLQL